MVLAASANGEMIFVTFAKLDQVRVLAVCEKTLPELGHGF
jgi:hypothetical protein